MDAAVRDAVGDAVRGITNLADTYAHEFVLLMHQARSQEELEQALAGTLLSFLAEVLVMSDE